MDLRAVVRRRGELRVGGDERRTSTSASATNVVS